MRGNPNKKVLIYDLFETVRDKNFTFDMAVAFKK